MALARFRALSQSPDDPFRDVYGYPGAEESALRQFFGPARPPDRAGADVGSGRGHVREQDELVTAVELPGLIHKDIHLSITGDMLTIRRERQRPHEVMQDSYYRAERWWGKFERTLPLPIPVETGKVKASYRDGVLTVTLPKADAIKPKEIKVDLV